MITKSGSKQFAELCDKLIDEEGYHWLSPEIGRSRATDWMAFIFSHHEKDQRIKLATGQATTMEGACSACVENFHENQRIERRKKELAEIPEVKEALLLFKRDSK